MARLQGPAATASRGPRELSPMGPELQERGSQLHFSFPSQRLWTAGGHGEKAWLCVPGQKGTTSWECCKGRLLGLPPPKARASFPAAFPAVPRGGIHIRQPRQGTGRAVAPSRGMEKRGTSLQISVPQLPPHSYKAPSKGPPVVPTCPGPGFPVMGEADPHLAGPVYILIL